MPCGRGLPTEDGWSAVDAQGTDGEPRTAQGSTDDTAQQEEEICELREEVEQLHQALSSHAAVDQAMGALSAIANIRPEQSWDVLREVSQHTNIKLRIVAELVIDWTCDGELPEPVRDALHKSLARQEPCDPERT